MHPLDFLFPKFCVGCGKTGRYLCRRCAQYLIPVANSEMVCPVCRRPAYAGLTHPYCRGRGKADGFAAFFRYQGVVRKAIREVKFRNVSGIIGELNMMVPPTSYNMIRNWPGALSAILTPIPLSIKRLRNRGFNQAELVAAGMAVNLGLAVRTDILVRVKDVSPQTEIKSREKRLMNVKGIFQVRKEVVKAIKNSVIIVADDVSTTGATLNEAVRTLKMGGAKTVYEVSLTR